MAWFDDLQSASWRGLPFAVTADPTRAGRRIALHEYPYRDAQPVWPEDTGRGPRGFNVTGFLIGDDVIAQRRRMTDAADQQSGAGELVHPQYGAMQVVLLGFSCGARADQGRMVEVQFEFIEAGAQVYPESNADTGAQVDAAATVAQGAAAADYANRTQPPAGQTTTAGRGTLDAGTSLQTGIA